MLDPVAVRIRLLARELVEAFVVEHNDDPNSTLVDTINGMSDHKLMSIFEEKMNRAKLSFTTFIVSGHTNEHRSE